MRTVCLLLLAFFATVNEAGAQRYFEQSKRGWFWYEPARDKAKRREEPVTVKRIRERGTRLFEAALISPTKENVKAYMEHQKLVLERSEEFSRVWKRVLWESPALDATVESPVSMAGAEISRKVKTKRRDEVLGRISRVGKLVFFFRSDCPFCRGQAEVLRTLERRHGIGVLAASLDGTGLPPLYPRPVAGRAQAARLGVRQVPALFLFVPSRSKIARIGTGYLTLGEIRRRLYVVGEEILEGGRRPGASPFLVAEKRQ